MALTFLGYLDEVRADFQTLPFEKLLFFSSWCSEYLFKKYGEHFNETDHEADYEIVKETVEFLWKAVDAPSSVSESAVEEQIEKLHTIELDGIDLNTTAGFGILKLLETVEGSLMFIQDPNFEYAVTNAFYPLDVVDFILTNDLGLDTANPDKHIEHPISKEEFDTQIKLREYLKGNDVSSADKELYR